MKVIKNPTDWKLICERPSLQNQNIAPIVADIMQNVQEFGDEKLFEFTKKFDKADLEILKVSQEEIKEAVDSVSEELKNAIKIAYKNIYTFHEAQLQEENKIEVMKGVTCWRKQVAIDSVGLYIPGGTAPLFSTVLMLGIPSQIAKNQTKILCTPPNSEGKINPAILFTAQLCGITEIYKVGGAQAIAAMTFGTESIPQVNKIFGPGNAYVTEAKKQATNYGIAIDMPAGPSEVLVIADEGFNPKFAAADLLAQAEHGIDSQVILVTNSENFANQTLQEIENLLQNLPRKEIAQKALENSSIIILDSLEKAMKFSNFYAPEHLIIGTQNAEELAKKITNAGSVFLGYNTPESAGDYASGTNHTLPTYGFAKNYSGVSLDSFMKQITFQKITETGLKNIGNTVEIMAKNEGLDAHALAISVRLNELK